MGNINIKVATMNPLKTLKSTCYLLLFFFCLSLQSVAAAERVALVIGNGTYKNSPLKNPVNDANSIARALQALGFDVIKGINLNRKEIRTKIRSFGNVLKTAKTGLFYYAGHGVQYNGDNYLIPVNADINEEYEIKDEAISASAVLRSMENAGNPVNIVILDACRNNPFSRSFRSSTRGLTKMDGPSGSLIAYATAPGKVAADGSGNNGLYTQYLLEYMNSPGLKLEEVFKKVRIAVSKDTAGQQVPWENSSLMGDFYFTGKQTANNKAAVDSFDKYEKAIWNEVKKSPSKEMYEAYLLDYPNGHYSRIARIKVKQYQLQKKQNPHLAKLTIQSNIAGSTLSINGRKTDQTELNLKPGKYKIEVSKAGYQSYIRQLQLKAESERLIYAQLKKIPQSLSMATTSRTSAKQLKAAPSTPALAVIKEKITGMKLINIPSGCFLMGSKSPIRNEEPIHSVCFSNNFYIGKYEVTQGQWQALMGDNPSYFYKKGKCTDKDCPVENVSWYGIQRFINKLNNMTGEKYRLPTEAEWEYACRDKGQNQTACTDNPSDSIAWSISNSENRTHQVGLKQSNQSGLYDMIGNVKEWVQDWYDFHYYHKSPKLDPSGPSTGSARTIRGSSWNDTRPLRMANKAGKSYSYLGFRLAKSP